MPFGPGAGSRPGMMAEDPAMVKLRAIYAAYPTEGLRRYIQLAERRLMRSM